jgi:hypothetical protein
MYTFLQATEIASAACATLTVAAVVIFRFAWRRRKPLQEP